MQGRRKKADHSPCAIMPKNSSSRQFVPVQRRQTRADRIRSSPVPGCQKGADQHGPRARMSKESKSAHTLFWGLCAMMPKLSGKARPLCKDAKTERISRGPVLGSLCNDAKVERISTALVHGCQKRADQQRPCFGGLVQECQQRAKVAAKRRQYFVLS